MTALEVVSEITPQYLRERAAALRIEAEETRKRAVSMAAEAIRLEREAECLERVEHLPPSRPVFERSEREVLAAEVAEHLSHHRTRQGKSSGELAAHFNVPQDKMRAALALAVENGFVRRTGLNRGTRYWATGKAPETCEPFGKRWLERVRDAAIKLGTFTLAELAEELPELATATLRRWLAQLVEDGTLERERVGNAHVYAYVPPETPEMASYRRQREASHYSGGSAVAGSGKGRKIARSEVRKLLRTVERQGATIRQAKHGFLIQHDGEVITSVAKTTSDRRSMRNATGTIKRAGLDA